MASSSHSSYGTSTTSCAAGSTSSTSSSTSYVRPGGSIVSSIRELVLPLLLLDSQDASIGAHNRELSILALNARDGDLASRALRGSLALFSASEYDQSDQRVSFTPTSKSGPMKDALVPQALAHWYNSLVLVLHLAVLSHQREPMDTQRVIDYARAACEHHEHYVQRPRSMPKPLIPLVQSALSLAKLILACAQEGHAEKRATVREFHLLASNWTAMAQDASQTHTALVLLPSMTLQTELALSVWLREIARYTERHVFQAGSDHAEAAIALRKAKGVYHLLQLLIADVSNNTPYMEYTAAWRRWSTVRSTGEEGPDPQPRNLAEEIMRHPFARYGTVQNDTFDSGVQWLEFRVQEPIQGALKWTVASPRDWDFWHLPRARAETLAAQTRAVLDKIAANFGSAPFQAEDPEIAKYITDVKSALFI